MLVKPRTSDTAHASKNENDSFFKSRVQTKLAIGRPGDKYEVEADKTADSIVSKLKDPKPAAADKPGFFSPKPVVQAKKQEQIQPKEDTGQEKEEIQEKPLSESITPLVQTSLAEESVQEKCDDCDHAEKTPVQTKCADCEAKEKQAAITGEQPVQQKCDKCAEEEKTPVQTKCADCEAKEKQAALTGEQLVQQKCDKCEEKQAVQAKKENGSTSAGGLSDQLSASKGGGSAMANTTQQEMSGSFGTDFSNVRIHTGSNAVQMNKELGSHAFTNGSDIYFNEGKYNPGSDSGKHLLAHELTHTVQQGAATSHIHKKADESVIQKDDDPCAEKKEKGSEAEAKSAETAPADPTCAVSNPSAEQPPEGQEKPEGEDTPRDIEATEKGPVNERQSHAPPADKDAPKADGEIQKSTEKGTEKAMDPCAMRQQKTGAKKAVSGVGGAAAAGLVPQPPAVGAREKEPAGGQKKGGKGAKKGKGKKEGDFLVHLAHKGVSKAIHPEGLGEQASPELMEQRDAAKTTSETAMATAGLTQAEMNNLASGGVQYQAPVAKTDEALANHAAVSAQASSFLSMGATRVNGLLQNGLALASGIRSSVAERKSTLMGDIAIKRKTTKGFFTQAKASARAKATAAKTRLNAQHTATLLQIELGAMLANMQVQQTHKLKTLELQLAYNAQLVALSQAYQTGYNGLIEIGNTQGRLAENFAAKKAGEYRRAEGAPADIRKRVTGHEADGFWDGYLTYNRYMARADSAKEVGKQYKEGMASQAKAQADTMMCGQAKDGLLMDAIFQKGNESLQCAVLNAGDAIAKQRQAALMQAMFAHQELTATIDNSLKATITQLSEKEAMQLQLLNDYGIRQLMAIEKDGESAIGSALKGVNTAVGQLAEFLKKYKQTIEKGEAPDPAAFAVSQQLAETQFDKASAQTENAITTTIDTTQLALSEGGNRVMIALGQLHDQGIFDGQLVMNTYETSIDGLVSNGITNYVLLLTNATQAITGEQQNGVNTLTGIVTGISGLLEGIKTSTADKFTAAGLKMEKGMQKTIHGELNQKICTEAEKAAADVQPWWKTVLKVLLVILVIVVVAFVIGPAIIGAVGAAFTAMAGSLGAGAALAGTIGAWAGPIIGGAIVGALSGAVIQVGNNLIDIAGTDKELTWEAVGKGVWGAMIAGAIGGALGGLGGQFAQVLLGRLGSGLGKFAAEFVINSAFDFVGGILGDLANGNPITLEGILMGLAIGGAVQVSMGGLSALAKPKGATPHVSGEGPYVEAGGTPHGGEAPTVHPGGEAPPPKGFKAKAQEVATKIQDFQGRMTEAGQNVGGKAGFGKNAPTVAATKQNINEANARIHQGEAFPTKNKPTEKVETVEPTTKPGTREESQSEQSTKKTTKRTVHQDATEIEPGTGIVSKVATKDGHTVKVLKDGRIMVCSQCGELRLRYADELANNPKLRDKLNTIEGRENPHAKADEAAKFKAELDSFRNELSDVRNGKTNVDKRVGNELAKAAGLPDAPEGYHWRNVDGSLHLIRTKGGNPLVLTRDPNAPRVKGVPDGYKISDLNFTPDQLAIIHARGSIAMDFIGTHGVNGVKVLQGLDIRFPGTKFNELMGAVETGRIRNFEDWVAYNRTKAPAEMADATVELREAMRVTEEKPGATVSVGAEQRAPKRTNGESVREVDFTTKNPAGNTIGSNEVSSIHKPVEHMNELLNGTTGIGHITSKVKSRMSDNALHGTPLIEHPNAIIEIEVATKLVPTKEGGVITQKADGTRDYTTKNGIVNPGKGWPQDMFNDFINPTKKGGNITEHPDSHLLNGVTLVDRSGKVLAEYINKGGVWTRLR